MSRLWDLYQNPSGGHGVFYDPPEGTRESVSDALDRISASTSTITANIPTDFDTLQDALDYYSTRVVKQGTRINLNIESGHQPESGIDVSDGSYGHFWVTSDDALVTVGAGYTGSFIVGINCHLPVLDCKVDADGKGGTAYDAARACLGYITSGSGVINSGGHGANIRASTVYASGTVWDGAAQTGIRIIQGANATFQSATANGCGVFGTSISSVYVSRGALLNFSSGTANNSRGTAIRVRRSFFGSFDVTIENAAENGVWADHGSTITIAASSVTGSGTDDLHVSLGGTIHASNTPTTNSVGTQPVLADTNVEAFNLWTSNGCITQENAPIASYYSGGDDVAVSDGGTGASTASDARTNLGAAAASDLSDHENDTSNPHSVTKAQVGLGNVTDDAQLKIASNLSDLNDAGTARSNLGANDASNLDTGTLDDARLSSDVLLAGDFGVGGGAVENNNWDTIDESGFYYNSSSSATGIPLSVTHILLIHFQSISDQAVQWASRTGGSTGVYRVWTRRKDGGAWQDWTEFFHLGNIVGTVSESSGTPTGAIIEESSNSNGEYTRWADGTQICVSPVFAQDSTFGTGNGFRSSADSWTFPAEFTATPAVTGANDSNPNTHWAVGRGSSATGGSITTHSWTSQTGRQVQAVAHGRWF